MKFFLSCVCILILAGTASAKGDAVAGKQKSTPCAACHGADGNSVNPEWPKIAGQAAVYATKHLQFFKQNKRINPLMNSQAMALSEQDIEDLAAYYESVQTSPGAADENLLERGMHVYRGGNIDSGVPACIACHGPKGNGNPAAGFPKVSYQHAAYTAARLRAYRSGTPRYPGSELMNSVAKNMTEEEIDAVSSYIQGLH